MWYLLDLIVLFPQSHSLIHNALRVPFFSFCFKATLFRILWEILENSWVCLFSCQPFGSTATQNYFKLNAQLLVFGIQEGCIQMWFPWPPITYCHCQIVKFTCGSLPCGEFIVQRISGIDFLCSSFCACLL